MNEFAILSRASCPEVRALSNAGHTWSSSPLDQVASEAKPKSEASLYIRWEDWRGRRDR